MMSLLWCVRDAETKEAVSDKYFRSYVEAESFMIELSGNEIKCGHLFTTHREIMASVEFSEVVL